MLDELKKLKEKGLYRKLRTVESAPGAVIRIEGKEYINFSSNNYMGLAAHLDVINAAVDALRKWGAGSASSRLIAGTLSVHNELEDELSRFKGKPAALVFSSGYQANLGILSALLGRGDCIIMDKLNHASLWDGARMAGARIFAYEHTDMESLEKILMRAKGYKKKLVVTDSLFSMDGDIAPLNEIAALSERYGALAMIDEAHATGVFGSSGAGLAEHFNISQKIDIIMGTLSKAMGSQGAYVCASREIIEYLINKSRSFIYTTALAPANTAAALKALQIIKTEPARRKTLLSKSERLRGALRSSGMNCAKSESQIVPVIFNSTEKMLSCAKVLLDNNIFAAAIRAPTVPANGPRIRISVTADHTEEHIRALTQTLLAHKEYVQCPPKQ